MARIDITARIETEGLAQTLARLSSHDLPIAIRAGVRLAASGARKQLAKSIREHYGLTSSRIKQDISQAQFIDGGMAAVIKTSRKPITGMQFGPRKASKGISLAIYRGKRSVYKSGFMQFSKEGRFSGTLPFKPNPNRPYSIDLAAGLNKPQIGRAHV